VYIQKVLGSICFLAPVFLYSWLQPFKIILTTNSEVKVDRAEDHILNFFKLKGVGNSLPDTIMIITVAKAVTFF